MRSGRVAAVTALLVSTASLPTCAAFQALSRLPGVATNKFEPFARVVASSENFAAIAGQEGSAAPSPWSSSSSERSENVSATTSCSSGTTEWCRRPFLGRFVRATTASAFASLALPTVAAAVTSTGASAIPLRPVLLACFLPPLLGFYQQEYGVSYGYGLAVASAAALALRHRLSVGGGLSGASVWHAGALVFYGVRLSAFLLYREATMPRFREFRDRIEARAVSRGPRWRRAPFWTMCGALYACLCAPALLALSVDAPPSSLQRWSTTAAWAGFVLAAWGDLVKTVVKAREKNEDFLVASSGPYRLLRHPNYTGEALGWTFSLVAGAVAAATATDATTTWWRRPALWAGAAGWAGINFVLCSATAALESKQFEKYGETEKYAEWKQRAWGGFTL